MKFSKKLIFIGCFLLLAFLYFILKAFIIKPSNNTVSYQNNNNNSFNLNLPHQLNFCGEEIPINNSKINKALSDEFYNNAYWQSNSFLLFRRAQRWFPIIEPILKKNKIPDDFKYLAVIESHLSNVNSQMGAVGFWQLVPSSASKFGIEINEFVDERYDVEKSTEAACGLINQAYSVFKNWTLSAAAYNFGINGIMQSLDKQKANSYFDLMLNNQTGSYIYRLMAYKTLLESPKHFGIHKIKAAKISFTFPCRVLKLDSAINYIDHFAEKYRVSKKEIFEFNPWLLQSRLPNSTKKTYHIKLHKSASVDYSGYLNDLNSFRLSTEQNVPIQDSLLKIVKDTLVK